MSVTAANTGIVRDAVISDPNVAMKFWKRANVSSPDECWNWTGAKVKGYGQFRLPNYGTFSNTAHRIAYEILVGPIPPGLVLDHLCRNPSCVNPSHLEPVTPKENVLRGNADWRAKRTHCPKGHEFTPENTRTYRSRDRDFRPARECKLCTRERRRAYRENGPPPRTHSRGGYVRGCRCDVCCEANRLYGVVYRRQKACASRSVSVARRVTG